MDSVQEAMMRTSAAIFLAALLFSPAGVQPYIFFALIAIVIILELITKSIRRQ